MNDETRSSSDEMSQSQRPLGWWESLNTTPLRDALRGNFAAQLSYRRVLRESLLPAPIIAVIEKIIRRARLWRRERFDVARELINHFREGLDRGATPALLVDQFGSVPTASRLIRRAKIRQRPVWWKTWFAVSRTLLAILAIFIVVYSVQAVRYFAGKPVITHNYLKEMNDAIRKIPMEDRGWPRYVEAMKGFPEWPKGIRDAAKDGPTSAQWPILVKFVEENRSRIPGILKAAEKPNLGWLWEKNEGDDPEGQLAVELIDLSIESVVANVRNAWQFLQFAIDVDVQEGRSDAIYENLLASLRIAGQLLNSEENPPVINQLVAIDLINTTSKRLSIILFERPDLFTLKQLEGLSRAWTSFNSCKLIRFSYESERMMDLDVLQRIYTTGANGYLCYEGRKYMDKLWPRRVEVSDFLWGPVLMTYTVNRQQAIDQIDAIMEEFTKLYRVRPWEWTEEQNQQLLAVERDSQNWLRNPLLILVAAISRLAKNAELAELNRSATLVALAISSFKSERGHWPEALERLVPDYLPSIPLDPADGQPLRYKLTADGPLVYSVGPDRFDDGGKPAEFQLKSGSLSLDLFFVSPSRGAKIRNNPKDEYHGDSILWPPVEKKGEAKPASTKVE